MVDLKSLFPIDESQDEKSQQILLKAIKNANQEGFDYLEFLVSVAKLKDMQMDEATALKSAFSTASSFGVTKDT